MIQFGKNSLATIEYTLSWQVDKSTFEERFLARRVNSWRDIFPPGLLERLAEKSAGQSVTRSYAPGELVDPYDPSRIRRVPAHFFEERSISGRRIRPRVGRFYPQGLLWQPLSVYPSTMTPLRLLANEGPDLIVDLNHPLARYPLTLKARIQCLEDKRSDTGGTLYHWAEEITHWGPGMQTPLPNMPTDFFDQDFFLVQDRDDEQFYAKPRLIGHVDIQASCNLKGIYSRHLKPGMRVIDLMSSVQSHLPLDLDLEVIGLGLNAQEMSHNPRLSKTVVQDLNHEPALPPGLGMFDVAVLSLSIEYLTQPVEVLKSVRAALRPGGAILVGTSNRWFPTKAVEGWLDLHEFERLGLVLEMLRQAGFSEKRGTISVRNDWRPQDDRHFLETRGVSDPVYVAWSQVKS